MASHPDILSSLQRGLEHQRTVSPAVLQCQKQEASMPDLPIFPQVQFNPITVFLAETRAGSRTSWDLFLESAGRSESRVSVGWERGSLKERCAPGEGTLRL